MTQNPATVAILPGFGGGISQGEDTTYKGDPS